MRYALLVASFSLLTIASTAIAAAPTWWSERGVQDSLQQADDYAAINQGQLKNLAFAAHAEMEDKLPGGAGSVLDEVVAQWENPTDIPDDYALVNQGQLKALAKPFYDRLILVGYTTRYPWTSTPDDDTNYTPANIGMAKHLFDFDFSGIVFDADGDGIADTWEAAHHVTDPNGDEDGDGLDNLGEYLAGTNPHNTDSDDDGLPDDWEVANGLNPLKDDSDADPDQDGLTNSMEYVWDTNPNNADTDNDLALDGVEIFEYGSDPLNANTDGDYYTDGEEILYVLTDPTVPEDFGEGEEVLSVSGAAFVADSGQWGRDYDLAYSLDWSGWLEYDLPVSSDGDYVLEVSGEMDFYDAETNLFKVRVHLDGIDLGIYQFPTTNGIGHIHVVLPHLSAGDHQLRITWVNYNPYLSLSILELRLLGLDGTDADGNGYPDWFDLRIANIGDLDGSPITSFTSPYCLEGESRFTGNLELTSSYTEEGYISAHTALTGTYYANIPLSSTEATVVDVRDQGGLIQFQKTITWVPLNLPDTQDQLIRQNDSLMLAAHLPGSEPADPVSIVITAEGATEASASYEMTSAEAATHLFESPGTYTVRATYLDEQREQTSSETTVRVVSGHFDSSPAAVQGYTRSWELPSMPPQAIFETDPFIQILEPTPPDEDSTDSGRSLTLKSSSSNSSRVVARLGESGPIMAATTVTTLTDLNSLQNHYTIQEQYIDGTQLAVKSLILGGEIPEGFTAVINLRTSGALFLDGSTILTLTADDIGPDGIYSYGFIMSYDNVKICHSITFYDNGTIINPRYLQ